MDSLPERNPLVAINKWKKQGIRKTIVKNFIMYYWIDQKNMVVHITAVVYGKRHQLRELEKMEPDG